MSQAIFPALPGLLWDITRTPVWSTTKKVAVSLRQYRSANASYPIYRVRMAFEFLRQSNGYSEMATLAGFFNARQGGFDSFLWTDPDDNSVITQALGTGDGSNRLFQLVRTFGGYVEPVFDVNAAPQIYVNAVLKTLTTDYTLSATGLVAFVTAPGNGVAVTWSGTYYRRVCFTQDQAEFSQFMNKLWTFRALDMESVKP